MPPALAVGLDGSRLGLLWTLPFAGLLLSIALLPALAPGLWHRHHGKIAAFWALVFLIPCALQEGLRLTTAAAAHMLVDDYLPFLLLLLSLFTVAGGVRLRGRLSATPAANTALLACGSLLASIAGTTGAAMLLVRPLIAANETRRYRTHVFVFFIVLVGNIGGALTPLGDPPLFLGFLQGVPFFWPAIHLLLPMLATGGLLLAMFYALDHLLRRREASIGPPPTLETPGADESMGLEGKRNLVLLAAILMAILLSGIWRPGIEIEFAEIHLALENLTRDALLVAITLLSLLITPAGLRKANGFSWFPMIEVAKLFAGIFVTIIPAIAILRAGGAGALAGAVAWVSRPDGSPIPALYFWLTGGLSSLLDNAPTYLIFFNMAGGDPAQLTGPLASTLLAISAGAVFMGANSYIGNAPNLMVKSICEERGIRMPSFFAYMAWAAILLLPIYAGLSLIFFRG
jgi:Na+/H+ antiporter NhaD/arsenite permease-like protein